MRGISGEGIRAAVVGEREGPERGDAADAGLGCWDEDAGGRAAGAEEGGLRVADPELREGGEQAEGGPGEGGGEDREHAEPLQERPGGGAEVQGNGG